MTSAPGVSMRCLMKSMPWFGWEGGEGNGLLRKG